MYAIPKTVVATSDPLNICSGFALFPGATLRLGTVATNSASGTIFDIQALNLLLFRLSASAKYEVFAGVCGPAYALKMELEGSTYDNGTVDLSITDDEIAAGFIFGLNLSFGFDLYIDEQELKWHWDGWHTSLTTTWNRLSNVNLKLECDVIEVIYELIKDGFREGEGHEFMKVPTISRSLAGSYGLYDERADSLALNNGQMVAKPAFNLPIDICGMVPSLAEVNELLKVLLGRFSFGPLIGVQIPVKVNMKTVTLNSSEYELTFDNGTLSGSTSGKVPTNVESLAVGLEHTAGFDLTLGLFLNFNIVKFVNVGFSISWPILDLLNIEPKLGPYDNSLSATVGTTVAKSCAACGSDTGVFDVIFEGPGGLGL